MAPKRRYTQLETPKKNRIVGAVEFCEAQGIQYSQTAIARTFGASRNQVAYALGSDLERTGKYSNIKASNH